MTRAPNPRTISAIPKMVTRLGPHTIHSGSGNGFFPPIMMIKPPMIIMTTIKALNNAFMILVFINFLPYTLQKDTKS